MKNPYEYKLMTSFIDLADLTSKSRGIIDFTKETDQINLNNRLTKELWDLLKEAEEHERTDKIELISHSITYLPNNVIMASFLFRLEFQNKKASPGEVGFNFSWRGFSANRNRYLIRLKYS